MSRGLIDRTLKKLVDRSVKIEIMTGTARFAQYTLIDLGEQPSNVIIIPGNLMRNADASYTGWMYVQGNRYLRLRSSYTGTDTHTYVYYKVTVG